MKKKTHEEYVSELEVKNPNIKAVETYIGANTKILHKCLICEFEWYATPHNILRGRGCPKCSNHVKLNHDDYVNRLSTINPNIKVLGHYVNYATPILHRCLVHGVEWHTTPGNILSGHGCKKCANDKLAYERSKSKSQYAEDLKKINQYIIVVGEYVNAHTPVLHRCLIDGFEWYAKPNNILSGKGCPKCAESKGEREVRQWLDCHNIAYKHQKVFKDCVDIKPLPFDFYLPDYNVAIEYQGEQHYKSVDYFGGEKAFEKRKLHDKIKSDYCAKNNILLLAIPYTKNVEEELNNFLFI